MGIRDRPIVPRSPWQNGQTERLIGSIRRECLNHVVVFGERHLRHVLLSYMQYYNGAWTILPLNTDAPIPRAVQAIGRILLTPILGGLHHQYVRILFSTETGPIGRLTQRHWEGARAPIAQSGWRPLHRTYVRPLCLRGTGSSSGCRGCRAERRPSARRRNLA